MGYMDLALSYSNQMRVVEAPASGGGLSQNGKFSYGYASSAGKRSSMEDFFETRIDGIDGEIVGLFGVFDGHGGARAAEYVKRHLFSNLITHPKFISDTKSAIADAYTHTDSELLKSENSQTRDAGSTASTAILVGDRLLVANVGDSRAVICRGGNAFAVSRDHKPDQSDERERIENAGGFVMWAGTWRVGGVLAVSRAFGDRLLKQYVVADPEIQEEKIDDSLEFLILASDGLWDVFSNEEAVAVVKEVEDPEESSKKLVGEAIRRGSADNITCVVVRFLESKTANNGSTSSQEANQGELAVRNDSDHKNSAKETNQDHTAVHRDMDRNTDSESLNQKPVAARSNETSNQKPIARSDESSNQKPIAGRNDESSNKKSIAASSNESLNQKPTEARSNDSLNQKPTAFTEAERSVSSEQSGLPGEKNQMPTAIRSDSEAKSSDKVPNQRKITVDNDLDHIIAKKPVTSTHSHTTSLEQSGSTSEKNRKPNEVHSDSSASKASSVPSISY
ncbi:PREDICTED: probable protein phosphatase 2C 71 [Camelina sativa]|uniref:protein-serine/threonine phosphatase n=1 Tax=Camelina sativa TaxID=90675 RepID=A0ABM0VE69_CAMSA|nr:PREDICTED: probable protein phosphatase 2C 71 [Camelina sativa]